MRTIITLLADVVSRQPERSYLAGKTETGWREVSFAEADRVSDATATWFLSLGYERGDRVALCAEGRPEWVLAELGMLKAGLVSVPLSIKLLSEEIPFRLNHSAAVAAVLSHITLPKVLDSWSAIETKPLLILLDEPSEPVEKRLSDLGVARGSGWHTWSDIVESGGRAYDKDPEAVRASVAQIDEEDTVNICYTSGTTGNPKGIMLSHRNYWANATAAVEYFGLPDAEYESLVILPLDHSFAHTVATYAGLARAITLSFVDARQGAMSILRNIPINLPERNPTFLLTVPSLTGNFMKKIAEGVKAKGRLINGIFTRGIAAGVALEGDGYRPPPLRTRLRYGPVHSLAKVLVFSKVKKIFGNRIKFFVGGGAILEKKQQEFYAALGVPVYQGYGLTEAAPIISTNTPAVHKYGTSGNVLPGVTCKIMKNDIDEAAPGEKGQIVIKGENVMKGYFRNPEATTEALRDGWLWTGDLGYFDEDGFLMVVGREKALLIAADGEKYPPETIEEAITAHTNVISQIMVYNDHRKVTSALITLDEDRCKDLFERRNVQTAAEGLDVLLEELNRYADDGAAGIPAAWRPALFEVIPVQFNEADQLINSTMKLVRHKVAGFYAGRIEAMYSDEDLHNERNRAAMAELFGLRNG